MNDVKVRLYEFDWLVDACIYIGRSRAGERGNCNCSADEERRTACSMAPDDGQQLSSALLDLERIEV